jgi:hypothetical protein
MSKRIQDLRSRYPYMFERVIPYGLSIEPGWLSIIEGVCQQIDSTLDGAQARKANFSWIQIKEKFGTLRMHWSRAYRIPESYPGHARPRDSSIHFERLVSLQFDEGASDADIDAVVAVITGACLIPEDATRQIRQIIDIACNEAARTCQFCGAPGRHLTPEDGCVITACDKHATRDAIIAFRRQEQAEEAHDD